MISAMRFFSIALLIMSGAPFATASDRDLTGVWEAYRNFGPEVRGELTVVRTPEFWHVDIAGHSYRKMRGKNPDILEFELPGGRGEFSGRFDGQHLRGHWTQPAPVQVGQKMSSPIHFVSKGDGRWSGTVIPRESEFTFYLPVTKNDKGSHAAYLRNPDRNLGVFYNVRRIEQKNNRLKFIGTFFRGTNEQTLFEGIYHERGDYLTALLNPYRGGSYDFHRVTDHKSSHFYARGLEPTPVAYEPPLPVDDGWDTATLEDVGLSFEPLRQMIEKEVEPPATSVNDFYLHGVLIARHGKLVFEQYFHGMHRNKPHDTRSASKSMAAILVGAAAHAGFDIQADTSVYRSLVSSEEFNKLEQRKKDMTLEHLLTMSSGYYCDDNDENAPGNENTMQEQEAEPDWYRYTLRLPMSDTPGNRAVYCSANSNLIGAVLSARTGSSVRDVFARYLAEPLGIRRYYLGLQPTGEVYLGGGSQWLPRDFMKIGQLMLNGGTWQSRRIVSQDWVRRSLATQTAIGDRPYGYQWWIAEYPYKNRTVRAFFAGGNGGQIVVGIPELDMLVAFFGGNYSSPMSRHSQNVLVPKYILKAVDE